MTVETAPPLQTKWGIARLGQNGYYRITSKKEGNCDKLLHRLIFEDFYNINLNNEFPEGIHIHHINGNRLDNNMWNLEPLSPSEHIKLHMGNGNHHGLGKPLSEETKKKISNAHEGFVHSEETKKKISESRNGMLNSLESKLKMSKNRNKTGFFRVHQMPHKECKQGFSWRYEYYDDTGKRRKLNSVNLNKLKKKVLAKGKIWEVINIDNAKLTCEKYDYNLEELM